MKKTPLFSWHEAAGAKIIDFGGYLMPVQYNGIIAEHRCVRSAAGLFDVSHMGTFFVRGSGAVDFLQHMTTNDAAGLRDGQAQYTLMLYPDGGIVDDLIIYRIAEDSWFMIVNAANMEKDFEWLSRHADSFGKVTLENRSGRQSLIALQGPESIGILERVFPAEAWRELKPFHFRKADFDGGEVVVAATGYTGERGVEISVPGKSVEKLWETLMAEGEASGLQPIGLGARDTLRLEMGYPLYGHEIDSGTNPLESRLKWVTRLDKPDFIGRDACLAVERAPRRTVVGFVMEERAIPRQGCKLFDGAGDEIGVVCSGTMSPTLQQPIGTARVLRNVMKPATPLFLEVRGKRYRARVVALPFVNRS